MKQYNFKKVLLLGMGAGSIIKLLQEKYDINCSITAIEKDEVVIELAKKYFDKIISRSKRGYLTLNFIGHIFGVNTLNKEQIFNTLSKNYKIGELREEPLTEANNTIVYWKDESDTN